MTEGIPPSLREIWAWKEKAEEVTRGLSRKEVLAFYRKEADEAERRLGITLEARSATERMRERRGK